MLYLKSSVDGFKVILGGFVMNLVIFLTLIISVRPPEYPDADKTKLARNLYIILVVYHFCFTVIKYLTEFICPRIFVERSALIMIFAVALLTYLC